MSEDRFRANQLAMLLTASLIFTAFTLVLPFLPFFLVSLGVEEPSRVAIWTGILLTVSPLLAALLPGHGGAPHSAVSANGRS